MSSDGFHCENCNSELIAESDKLAAEEKGDGEDNGRRRRREKLRELLEKMEVCALIPLAYLTFCLHRIFARLES